MVVKNYVPEQGDIVYVDFSPTKGKEQKGSRPALVLSRAFLNKANDLVLIAPITSKQKGYPFEVSVETKKITGVALIDQIRVVDYAARAMQFITTVPDSTIKEAKARFVTLVQ